MKDKGFSYDNKVQRYHGEGRESIIVMGKPFAVLENLSAPSTYSKRRMKKDKYVTSITFLVRNSSNLSFFPRTFALKRAFFHIDQVHEAHREIEVLSRLSNKNIVKSYHCEVSRHEGQLGVSICTEYCGNNLWRRIKSGLGDNTGSRMAESEIAGVLIGVTNALSYLHAQQPPIAYRHIHPKHILITSKCTGPEMYKLCNFSMATTEAFQCANREEAERVKRDMDQLNTLSFVAPEMADPMKGKRIDQQVDMWALGVLLYSMMYMKVPFKGSITSLSAPLHYVTPANSTFSGSYQTILSHLLDPNPETRWNVFALINFLRFDEDIGRHLGTFFFTYTECPEGWEEQELFTVGRAKPSKNPAVRYEEGAPVAHVGDERTEDDEGRNGTRSGAAPDANSSAASAERVSASDSGFQRALALLESTGDIDDPRVAPYREALVRHQTAMWMSMTGRRPETSANDGQAASASTVAEDAPPRRDELEDLFGSPEQAAPAAVSHVDPFRNEFTGTAPSAGSAGGSVPAVAAPADIFSANDLFASAPSGQAPVQQGVPAVWASDPLTSESGLSSGNFFQQTAGGAGAGYSPFQPAYPPPTASPPITDFLAPPPGEVSPSHPVNAFGVASFRGPDANAAPAAYGEPKDPFAGLFSNATH